MTDAFHLVTADDVRLAARRWSHPEPRAAVVLAHGFGASSVESDVVALAEHLHRAAFEVVTYDARGHGGSGGACTLGDLERHDVAAAVAEAARADTPVVVVGASMGAIAVLHHAAGQPESVAGLVTVSCPARWKLPRNARGVLSALMTQTAPGRWVARRHLGVRIATRLTRSDPPIELVSRVATPIAVVHGSDDPFIDQSDAVAIHAAASEPRRLIVVDDMGHAFPELSIDPVHRAVEWVLGPPPS